LGKKRRPDQKTLQVHQITPWMQTTEDSETDRKGGPPAGNENEELF
jgi:hypothetical protein